MKYKGRLTLYLNNKRIDQNFYTLKEIKSRLTRKDNGYILATRYGETTLFANIEKGKIYKQSDMEKFYKGQYIICLYDSENVLFEQFNNPRELADFLKRDIGSVRPIISKILKGAKDRNGIIYQKQKYKIVLVNVKEQNENEWN